MTAPPEIEDARSQAPRRPREPIRRILVSGSGAHLGQILEMARATGLPVWIPQELAEQGYVDGVSVLTASTSLGPGTLWITGTTDSDGRFSWTSSASGPPLVHAHGLRPKHPALLSDYLPRRVPLVVCGFHGSGREIFSDIAEALVGESGLVDVTQVQAYSNAFAADYDALLRQSVEALGDALELPERSYTQHLKTEASCFVASEDQLLVLSGLPIRSYLSDKIHTTHEPFGERLKRLTEAGTKCILVTRHPLDTLVSVANEFGQHGLDLFGDRRLLRAVCRALVVYYESFDAAPKNCVTIVRHEDLYADFAATVTRISGCLGIQADAGDVGTLRERLFDAPMGHSGHASAPDSGTWKTKMPGSVFNVAAGPAMKRTFQRFGYPIPLASELATTPQPISVASIDRHSQAGIAANLSNVLQDRDWRALLVSPPDQLRDVRTTIIGDLYCISTEEALLEKAEAFAPHFSLQEIVMAGREHSRPGLPTTSARKVVRKLLARILSLRTKPVRSVPPGPIVPPAVPAPGRPRQSRRSPKWPSEDFLDVRRVLMTKDDMRDWSSSDLAPFVTEMMNAEAVSFFRNAFGYLYGSGLKGDYHEYGCFSARTFRLALSEAHKWQMDDMRLYAFDSFCGLPPPKDVPELESWQEGAMSMSLEEFESTVSELGFGLDRVTTIKGYYSESLTRALQHKLLSEGRRIAFCNIDCDLRESAEDVFRFVEPLVDNGTLVYLDDYFVGYGGSLDRGVAGAFWQFLERGHWKHERFRDVGFWGKSFILYR